METSLFQSCSTDEHYLIKCNHSLSANVKLHIHVECHETIGLWQHFFDLFTLILNNLQLTNSQILYGILQTDEYALALNWVILIMKHIYTHKWEKIAVSFAAFLEHLKYQTKIEKESEKCTQKVCLSSGNGR